MPGMSPCLPRGNRPRPTRPGWACPHPAERPKGRGEVSRTANRALAWAEEDARLAEVKARALEWDRMDLDIRLKPPWHGD